jgi:Asp-tRNA(Asn)/Glu-tRNA(Gln) amidotransferase A subunit family amidase
MPCGLDRRRMPVSLQVIGPPFGEALILLLGAALEEATDLHKLAPPL